MCAHARDAPGGAASRGKGSGKGGLKRKQRYPDGGDEKVGRQAGQAAIVELMNHAALWQPNAAWPLISRNIELRTMQGALKRGFHRKHDETGAEQDHHGFVMAFTSRARPRGLTILAAKPLLANREAQSRAVSSEDGQIK